MSIPGAQLSALDLGFRGYFRNTMQSVQRRFGKLLPRTADESQVAVLLKDFDDADRMLAKVVMPSCCWSINVDTTNTLRQIIDASKAWRDSWRDILVTQQRLVNSFQVMYQPFIGADDSYTGNEHAMTPQSTMQRTTKLSQGYEELKTDLLEEVNLVDTRIIKPATEAKEWIQPLKKVIRKREDRKVCCSQYTHKDLKAEIRSSTSKNIRLGSIMRTRKRKGQSETMLTWQRLRRSCSTQRKYVTNQSLYKCVLSISRAAPHLHLSLPLGLRKISAICCQAVSVLI